MGEHHESDHNLRRREMALIVRAQGGDQAAFATLVRWYRPMLTTYFSRRVGSDGEAVRDLVQETFVRAWQALPRYRATRSFSAWLYTIARNLLASHWRRAWRTVPLDHALDIPAPTTPQEAALVRERWEQFLKAVQELPARPRALLRSYYLEGKSLAVIAAEWGVSENAVKLLLSRTRARLRARVRERRC